MKITNLLVTAALGLGVICSTASAQVRQVTVTIENIAQDDSVSFAPLRLGFHSNVFDAFDAGEAAGDAIISVAEGGSGDVWLADFGAADPTAVVGSVVNGGPAVPAGNAGVGNEFNSTATATFTVDTSINPYFTFASMVVPSNDLFIGNDAAIPLFDASGNLLIDEIVLTGADVWNAGSELAIAENAAFLPSGTNADRVAENGVVEFSLAELLAYEGLETAAGYNYDNSLVGLDTEIYRISINSVVPEPSSGLMGLVAALGMAAFRKRR